MVKEDLCCRITLYTAKYIRCSAGDRLRSTLLYDGSGSEAGKRTDASINWSGASFNAIES
jgi:hypothetical protein